MKKIKDHISIGVVKGLRFIYRQFYRYPIERLRDLVIRVSFIQYGFNLLNPPPPLLKEEPNFNITPFSDYKDGAPNVLIVIHEAQRTGAPILGLNLITEFAKSHNVFVFILDDNGPLMESFYKGGAHVVYSASVRGRPEEAHKILTDLLSTYPIELAIANSIESSLHVLPILSLYNVFTYNLIHEFSSCYVNKNEVWRFMVDWPGIFIFSSRLTYLDALSVEPHLNHRQAFVIPQGRCCTPEIEVDEMNEKIQNVKNMLRPNAFKNAFVVVGLGSIHMRKGVDLFIQAAAEIVKLDKVNEYRFIWFGKSYEKDLNWGYDVFIGDQIKRAGLSHCLTIAEDTELLNTVYEEADFILLTSRLDPLPNIALDALDLGIPIICFDKASGIAEYLDKGGLGNYSVAEYLDVHDMAKKVVTLSQNSKLMIRVGELQKDIATKFFRFDNYVKEIIDLKIKIQNEYQRDLDLLNENIDLKINSAYYSTPRFANDLKIFLQVNNGCSTISEAYLRSWSNSILLRRPRPGFNPFIYMRLNKLSTIKDPFAEYLREGSKSGPWSAQLIEWDEKVSIDLTRTPKVALHIHAYYPELVLEIFEGLSKNKTMIDIYITVTDNAAILKIKDYSMSFALGEINYQLVENRGRDLYSLIKIIGPQLHKKYDYIGHLHTKKSTHVIESLGEEWRKFLIFNLVGDGKTRMMDKILSKMIDNPKIGLVFPSDPNIVGWDKNFSYALEIAEYLDLNISEEDAFFDFPVGTMFWARTEALESLFNSDLDEKFFPMEPVLIDGTYLHAFERLLPIIVRKKGFDVAQSYVPGTTR